MILGMVCAVRENMTHDQARPLARRSSRKGVRDVSHIGFMILIGPDNPRGWGDAVR